MRGKINNRRAAAQIRDFSSIRIPGTKITPTDIDGFIDYKNKIFIFFEAKYGNCELPLGQRLALERLCDATDKGGKTSIAFIVSHNAMVEDDILMGDALVTEYRYKFNWHKHDLTIKLSDAVNNFIKKHY